MKDVIVDDFQNSVAESLLRHKSILDILTKLQESCARTNRAVAKAVTNCGCVQINANKQQAMDNSSIDDMEELKKYLNPDLIGSLCDNCRDIISNEIGNNLFYLASLCNLLDLNLYDIFLIEYEKMDTLGKYSLR